MIASHLPSAFRARQSESLTRTHAAPKRRFSLLRVTRRSRRGLVRMPLVGLLSLLLVMGSSPGAAGTASAAQSHKEVNFNNQTSRTILLAAVMIEEANCGSEGWIFTAWWELPPGETRTFLTIGDTFYYHAHTLDGSIWDGIDGVDSQITLYASQYSFEWCQYESDDWLNLYGGGVVNTSAEGYQITLGGIDFAGRSSVTRNFTERASGVLFD